MSEPTFDELTYVDNPFVNLSSSSAVSQLELVQSFPFAFSTAPTSIRFTPLGRAFLPQQKALFDYDLQSVDPRCDIKKSHTYLLCYVDEILDPTKIPDEDIIAEMVAHDPATKMPPKSRCKIVFEVLKTRKGKPASVHSDDLLWILKEK